MSQALLQVDPLDAALYSIMGDKQEHDEAQDTFPEVTQTGRATSSPAPGLRNRPLGRAATFADPTPRFARRGSSFVSESLSESRRSFRESTDDLLLPRAKADTDIKHESSNWHSVPLGLALLPGVGGLLFQGGSAFITDLTLLGLAALFLNWALRLPWEWYFDAQAVVVESEALDYEDVLEGGNDRGTDEPASPEHPSKSKNSLIRNVEKELRIHELLALVACFIFPALGAWLLHAIRSQLSRPSESLISDYNLTIFLLASEVRPLRHLVKLVQRRTLFLQRTISAAAEAPSSESESTIVIDLVKRLEDMESRMASTIILSSKTEPSSSPTEDLISQASSRANEELRKTLQPEVDALNRAMRRYEKRSTTSSIQIETRLQELENRLQDVVILAAATQRNADKHAGNYTAILANWISACIVVPLQYAFYILTWPQRLLNSAFCWLRARLGFVSSTAKSSTGKGNARSDQPRRKSSKEKMKLSTSLK